MERNRENERKLDVLIYLVSMSWSAARLARGDDPFDFGSENTTEFLWLRLKPFIENPSIPIREAHGIFVNAMRDAGWVYHPVEDMADKKCPDLKCFDDLSPTEKQLFSYIGALVQSGMEFYEELRHQIENDLIDDLPTDLVSRRICFS